MNELKIKDASWDSNDELRITPMYENWENEYGSLDVMEIEAYNARFKDSVTVLIHLKDMIELHKFLGERIEFIKKSVSYKHHFEEYGDGK